MSRKLQTRISVIIPVYNASLLIERCLKSVVSQKGHFDLEIITIDDGSTDDSVKKIEAYHKGITILSQQNQGPAAARNKGIAAATGTFLAFLDADDYWKPTFLEETYTFLEQHPKLIAVSTGQIHKITGKEDQVMPRVIHENNNISKKGIVLNDFYEFWATHNHVCTGSVLMRTDIIKQTSGQRTELRITEDLEFWSYLATFGSWGFIPKVLFVSDGASVTKKNGWLRKNMIRWKTTTSIEEFTHRTLQHLNDRQKESYQHVIGWIAYNFTYSHIMAKNYDEAFLNTKNYGSLFPKSKISNYILWCFKFGRSAFIATVFLFRQAQIARQITIHRLNQ